MGGWARFHNLGGRLGSGRLLSDCMAPPSPACGLTSFSAHRPPAFPSGLCIVISHSTLLALGHLPGPQQLPPLPAVPSLPSWLGPQGRRWAGCSQGQRRFRSGTRAGSKGLSTGVQVGGRTMSQLVAHVQPATQSHGRGSAARRPCFLRPAGSSANSCLSDGLRGKHLGGA